MIRLLFSTGIHRFFHDFHSFSFEMAQFQVYRSKAVLHS
jgi:hypothetical protein